MVRGGIFVSTENNGLRFDIYERVNLPENVAAIEELEEIELVPRIQVIDQGELVLLQGQLVLNGIYRGEGFGQEQIALEHWIPVEISLPMSRVQQLDEITVDIDTFHVEPVSERALNITGVLTLRGIYLEAQEQQWEQEAGYDEQFNFVAQADADQEHEASWQDNIASEEEENRDSWFVTSEETELESEQLAEEWREFSAVEQQEEQIEATALQDEASEEVLEEASEQWEQAESEFNESEQFDYVTTERSEYIQEEEAAQQEEDFVYREEAVEAAEDLSAAYAQNIEEQVHYSEADLSAVEESHIAAWQASEPEVAKVSTSFGIKDLLSSSLREQAASELQRLDAERERIQQQLLDEQSQSEQLDWRQKLLQPDGKEQFRKIKMYIVQKNDTLDQIAGRYSINPRDLLNHNKLHETTISAGQLLYIP